MYAPEVMLPPAALPSLFITLETGDYNFADAKRRNEEPLLGDDLFTNTPAAMPSSPTLSLTFSAPFPCLADELEEQVKALEVDCFASSASQGASKVLRPNAQPALISDASQQQQQQRMIPVQQRPGGSPYLQATVVMSDPHAAPDMAMSMSMSAAASPKLQPATSTHTQPLQQLHPPMQIAVPLSPMHPGAAPSRSTPLAAALHNADCIRLGRLAPWPGAWSGCCTGPYCSKEKAHPGACNGRATIPGLSAYLPEELAALGVSGTVAELTGPLPPQAAAAAAAAAAVATTIPLLSGSMAVPVSAESYMAMRTAASLMKRKAPSSTAAAAAAVPTSSESTDSGSLTASDNISNNGDEAEQEVSPKSLRSSKRTRAAAADTEFDTDMQSIDDIVTDNETGSDEHKSSLTEETKLRPAVDIPSAAEATATASAPKKGRKNRRKGCPSARRSNSRKALRGSTSLPKSAAAGAAAIGGAALAAVSKHGRRPPMVWTTGETVDPRSGDTLTEVPPATFCTQCSVLSTPVWRAGPFGHKTLCNACGVRWMKVAPKRK